jgi:hypothetical protein
MQVTNCLCPLVMSFILRPNHLWLMSSLKQYLDGISLWKKHLVWQLFPCPVSTRTFWSVVRNDTLPSNMYSCNVRPKIERYFTASTSYRPDCQALLLAYHGSRYQDQLDELFVSKGGKPATRYQTKCSSICQRQNLLLCLPILAGMQPRAQIVRQIPASCHL